MDQTDPKDQKARMLLSHLSVQSHQTLPLLPLGRKDLMDQKVLLPP